MRKKAISVGAQNAPTRLEETVTLTPGQTFYEGPTDVHTVGRNASQTKPAKFLVVLLKGSHDPVAVPAN